jgi:soluble lytic murein transglycosylase-like protein
MGASFSKCLSNLCLKPSWAIGLLLSIVTYSAQAGSAGDGDLALRIPAGKGSISETTWQHLQEASRVHDIEVELLQAVIATESGFNEKAVSRSGAVGLMQIMPATAVNFGVRGDKKTPIRKKLSDPGTNINTGSRYLRYLLDLFHGQLDVALAAYNAGEGTIKRAGNKIPNVKRTQDYVKSVMQRYTLLKPPLAVSVDSAPLISPDDTLAPSPPLSQRLTETQ